MLPTLPENAKPVLSRAICFLAPCPEDGGTGPQLLRGVWRGEQNRTVRSPGRGAEGRCCRPKAWGVGAEGRAQNSFTFLRLLKDLKGPGVAPPRTSSPAAVLPLPPLPLCSMQPPQSQAASRWLRPLRQAYPALRRLLRNVLVSSPLPSSSLLRAIGDSCQCGSLSPIAPFTCPPEA